MSDQFKSNQSNNRIQAPWFKWQTILSPLYHKYMPAVVRHRTNVTQAILQDVTVLALMCWQVTIGIENQRAFYRLLASLGLLLPERSRFNRICQQAGALFNMIRNGLLQEALPTATYTIIDSMPMLLCQPIRNHSAKVFSPTASIGYNATKKTWFYGFKGHFQVTNAGIVVAYAITKASIHDVKSVKTLVNQYFSAKILADSGYISHTLHTDLKRKGIWFWTPCRKNMKQRSSDETLLKRQRRRIETVFSQLCCLFNIEHNPERSYLGFQTRLEQCLFIDTWFKIN